MPRYIVKLTDKNTNTDYYLEWSTVVDGPITNGMYFHEFKEYYIDNYGTSSIEDLQLRLARVESKGTSSMLHNSVDEVIEHNRAGENEKSLTYEEIVFKYCTHPPERRGSNYD